MRVEFIEGFKLVLIAETELERLFILEWDIRAGNLRNLNQHSDQQDIKLAALREELAKVELKLSQSDFNYDSSIDEMQQRLTAAEQRNAELTQALERGKLWVELFRSWFGDYGVSAEDHQMIIRTLRSLPHPPSEFDAALKPTESGASE